MREIYFVIILRKSHICRLLRTWYLLHERNVATTCTTFLVAIRLHKVQILRQKSSRINRWQTIQLFTMT